VTTVKILYFASLREKLGLSEETVEIPAEAKSIADVMTWLRQRGPEFKAAFEETAHIRAAINQQHVTSDKPIGEDVQEIAFFPPVTGG